VERRHADLAAQRRLRERDRDRAVQVGVAALEDFMLFEVDDDVQVAALGAGVAGLAFAGAAQPRAVIDAGGHLDFERLLALDAARAVTGAAVVLDHLAAASAGRACAQHAQKGLLVAHLAAAAAGRAAHGLRAFRRAAPVTHITMFQARHADLGLDALRRLFERDLDVVTQVGAALRPAPLTAPAEHVAEAEQVAQDVFESGEALAEARARARRRADAGVAIAVVARPHYGLG